MRTKILLVTSNREHCGIREYDRMLMAALKDDPELDIEVFPNPDSNQLGLPECEIIHLNHHAALHSSWTKERMEEYQRLGYKVTVTQHDTFEKLEVMLERGFPDFRGADGLVVHEEVEGLTGLSDCPTVNMWKIPQGVLPINKELRPKQMSTKVLGAVGFDLPWKNFDMLARVCEAAGWRLFLFSPGMAEERKWQQIKRINKKAIVFTEWHGAEQIVALLSACHATAFLYSTGNSGTSGAIRLGIAARRPMVAFASRQNRDLAGESAIQWVGSEEQVVEILKMMDSNPHMDFGVEEMEELADRDSWRNVGMKYKAMWLAAMEEK